jgi:hypothetical protein
MSVQPEFSFDSRYGLSSGPTALAHEVGTVLDVADRGVDGLGSISNQTNAEDIYAIDCSNGAGLRKDNAKVARLATLSR